MSKKPEPQADTIPTAGILDAADHCVARFAQLYRRQAALAEIELSINQPDELQATLNRITQVATELLPASGGASVLLWNAESEAFYVSASTVPGQPPQMTAKRVRQQEGATRWIVDHREPVIVSDIRHDPFTANRMLPEYGLHAYAGIPLLAQGQAIGVLYALDNHIREYTEDDLSFLDSLASRAALVIEKVRLYEELRTANQKLREESLEKAKVIDELQIALTNIKTLRGLIPICANCKNIRNDEGFWQQVEVYISTHAEVEFSHGICPDCLVELYPRYAKK